MQIPPEIQRALTPEALSALVHDLLHRTEGRRAGVNVALIVQTLMGSAWSAGPQQAALYLTLREAVRQRIEALPALRYVQGLS